LTPRRWFAFYSSVFETVEINNTFYHLPPEKTMAAWQRQAPEGFIYALKAPQKLTHERPHDQSGNAAYLSQFSETAGQSPRANSLPVPPWRRFNLAWLRSWVDFLPQGFDHVLEFRHPSWYVEEVRELLTGKDVGFCIHDMNGSASPEWVTGPSAYVRLHGPGAAKYSGPYKSRPATPVGQTAGESLTPARRYTCSSTITADVAAPADAQALRSMLDQGHPVVMK